MADAAEEHDYVGRGGMKLAHALDVFDVSVTDLACADFGCNVGGFTDCLLKHGARSVIAVDTGYGGLDYRLRTDDRLIVRERTNILHADPPTDPVDLVVADVGWTPQERIVPIALAWLHRRPAGRIITLVKPQYEREEPATPPEHRGRKSRSTKRRTILDPAESESIMEAVVASLPAMGVSVLATTQSPIRGGGSRKRGPGNIEYLALLAPTGETAGSSPMIEST